MLLHDATDLDDWLFWATNDGEHYVTLLAAYFDASKRDAAFVVAGVLFSTRQARKMGRRWRAIFNPYGGCHMTDLAGGGKDYQGVEHAVRDRLVKEAVGALCD